MVRQPHRLRALEVRVAGQDGVEVLAGARREHPAQLEQAALGRRAGIAQIQGQVGGDLVVAAAPGVQAARRGPDPLAQSRLDVHVDVLERGIDREAPGLDLAADRLEPLSDRLLLVGAEQAPVVEHPGVGEREPDVVAGEGLVEVDGGGEALDGGVRRGLEAAAPGLVHERKSPEQNRFSQEPRPRQD